MIAGDAIQLTPKAEPLLKHSVGSVSFINSSLISNETKHSEKII